MKWQEWEDAHKLFQQAYEETRRDNTTLDYFMDQLTLHMSDDNSPRISELLQKSHEAKLFNYIIAKVFKEIPNVVEVSQNNPGWGTDFGADLIITTSIDVSGTQSKNRILVQTNSDENECYDLNTLNQIEKVLQQFNADAAIIITTANKTPELDTALIELSSRVNKPVNLIAGKDVARFVEKYAKEVIFDIR